MTYAIGTRTEVLGTLCCVSPVHVGGWESTSEADLAVALDGSGNPVLPGTSIAGAIRAYLAGPGGFSPSEIEAVFGKVVQNSQDGSASWIRIDDAPIIGRAAPLTRDGVGIDRDSGSAARRILYTRQVLPPGTQFAFRIVVDTPAPDAGQVGGQDASDLSTLLDRARTVIVAGLYGGRIPIGAGRGRGFAKVCLVDPVIREADLADPAGMVAWLTGSVPCSRLLDVDQPPADRQLTITIHWSPLTPLLVRDSVENVVAGTLPLTTVDAENKVRLLVPGSSIRGAVRSHAERIVRTLTGQPTPPFDEALRNPPDGVAALFGVSPGSGPDSPGWRGAITFADCHSKAAIEPEVWQKIVACAPSGNASTEHSRQGRLERGSQKDATRAELLALINDEASVFGLGISDHVAIDRWTGGASEHRLFSVLEPAAGLQWEPITITVDTTRLGAAAGLGAELALPLLLLVLRDLRDGWISLGFGGTRGRGQIEVSSIDFSGDGLPEPWQSLIGQSFDEIVAAPPGPVVEAMASWTRYFETEAA